MDTFYRQMNRLQDEINDLFHSTSGPRDWGLYPRSIAGPSPNDQQQLVPGGGGGGGALALRGDVYTPRIDVKESNNEIKILADLPGIRKEDIKVDLVEGRLTVAGSRKKEERREGENWYIEERSSGSFSRTLRLPKNVKQHEIQATFKDGVLEVTVPKEAQATPEARSITID